MYSNKSDIFFNWTFFFFLNQRRLHVTGKRINGLLTLAFFNLWFICIAQDVTLSGLDISKSMFHACVFSLRTVRFQCHLNILYRPRLMGQQLVHS